MGRTKPSPLELQIIEINRAVRGVIEVISAGFWAVVGFIIASLLPGISFDVAWKVAAVIWFVLAFSKIAKYGLLALYMKMSGPARGRP